MNSQNLRRWFSARYVTIIGVLIWVNLGVLCLWLLTSTGEVRYSLFSGRCSANDCYLVLQRGHKLNRLLQRVRVTPFQFYQFHGWTLFLAAHISYWIVLTLREDKECTASKPKKRR